MFFNINVQQIMTITYLHRKLLQPVLNQTFKIKINHDYLNKNLPRINPNVTGRFNLIIL